MALHRPSRKSVEILEQVANEYAILNAPNEEDQEAYIQIYGRCHLETKEEIGAIQQNVGTIQRRLNTLENASTIIPSPPSHSSSIEGVRYELQEMNERQQEFEEGIAQRLDSVETLVSEIKDNLQEVDDRIDGVEVNLLEKIDEVEKNMDGRYTDLKSDINSLDQKFHSLDQRFDATDRRFDELEKNTDRRFDDVDRRFDEVETKLGNRINSVDGKLENFMALQQNGLAERLVAPVTLPGVEYLDSTGCIRYRYPLGPRRPVSYYWRMHNPKNHDKLEYLHEFYQLSYKDWAIDEDRDDDDDDDLDPPVHPSSLKEAIAMYPDRAVRALFAHLGLVYSRIEEHARKLKALDQDSGKSAEKRASRQALSSGAQKSKVRKYNPSTATTESGSPTSSNQLCLLPVDRLTS